MRTSSHTMGNQENAYRTMARRWGPVLVERLLQLCKYPALNLPAVKRKERSRVAFATRGDTVTIINKSPYTRMDV